MHPCLVHALMAVHCQLKARQLGDVKLVYLSFMRVVLPRRLQTMRKKWAMTSLPRNAREVI